MEKLLLFILYIIHIGLCILIQMLMQIKKSTFNPVDVEIPSYDLSKRKQEAKHENCPVQLSLKMLVSHLMLLLLLSHFSCVRHRWQPTKLPHPWDSPGKNTGVGCHFLLQCVKVKSESEVSQSCPTLSDPMDCSLPGSSVHGIFQARVLEWGAIAFSAVT